MALIRLFFRLTGFVFAIIIACLVTMAIGVLDSLRGTPIDRPRWARQCFRLMSRCLGWQIRVHGHPTTQETALQVANHISWADIPALGGITPTRFLAKSDVAHWPVVGWLARQVGTLFIKRGGGQARRIRDEIAGHLQQGEPVLIFPEGTTSCGVAVLPIYGQLLSAARDAGAPIQPVTIGYRQNGRPDAVAPFIGEDSFHRHLVRLLKQPPARIDVIFHPPIDTRAGTTLKELTSEVHQALSSGLTRIHSGELDARHATPIRTMADPELSHLP